MAYFERWMITLTVIVIDFINLVRRKKDSLACADVNCSQDYSLCEITAIMLRCIDEEVFFSEKKSLK